VSATHGLGFERLADKKTHLFIADGARPPRPLFVIEAHQPLLEKPLAPHPDHGTRQTNLSTDIFMAHPLSRQKNDLRATYQRMRQGSRTAQGFKFIESFFTQGKRNCWSATRHKLPPIVLRKLIAISSYCHVIHGTLH